MPRKCCVIGCRSNYAGTGEHVTVYRILSECKGDNEKLEKWRNKIPRDNLVVNEDTVVCIKHFASQFVVTHDSAVRPDGSVLTVRRSTPKLTNDAYPTLFENCPSYLSSEPPRKRRNPQDRRDEQSRRDEALFERWMSSDRIDNLDLFIQNVGNHITRHWLFNEGTENEAKCVNLYVLNVVDGVLSIKVSVQVSSDLSIIVCHKGVKFGCNKFDWVLGDSGKMDCWSKFTTLLTHLESTDEIRENKNDKILRAMAILNELVDDDGDDYRLLADKDDVSQYYRVVQFIILQLQLLLTEQKRYSAEFVRWSFQIFSLSPTAYNCLRDSCILLPHPTYLRTLSKCFAVEPGTECNAHFAYLAQKARLLSEHERHVTLLVDEIYCNPKVSYKAGTVEGFAENCELSQATTVQAFMICSVLSHVKDVAALVPIKNLTACYLKELIVKVVKMVEQAGFRVLCIISDNNRVNGNAFSMMCNGSLQSFVAHPCDNSRKLFFLFDSVHLMKCVRNNWINQKDPAQTLNFPDMDNHSVVRRAHFLVLKEMHESESHKLVKLAPSLCQKALNPSNTDRQSVPLMLRIFNDKVVTALSIYATTNSNKSEPITDTRIFIHMMLKLWKMLNVKHPLKGRNQRDIDSDPVRSTQDHQVNYLNQTVLWLKAWESMCVKNRAGCLTKETMTALTHTLNTLVMLIQYVMEVLSFQYVLLGKFQTDCLEYRFAQYRRMSGTTFHVSVREIIESEKKLKLMSVLSLRSASLGHVSIAQFTADCTTVCEDHLVDVDLVARPFLSAVRESESVIVSDSDMHALVFIAGYIGRKVKLSFPCSLCSGDLLSTEKMTCDVLMQHCVYTECLDRGGLMWPNQLLVDVVTRVFAVFQVLLSAQYEKNYIAVPNHKELAMHLCMLVVKQQFQTDSVCECGRIHAEILKQCVARMSNILLNNYCKMNNDSAAADKAAKCKQSRKLKTFSK